MTITAYSEKQNEIAKAREQRERERIIRINRELDSAKMAYRVQDVGGNTFTFVAIENKYPVYRGARGSKHIFEMNGLTVIQQYAE